MFGIVDKSTSDGIVFLDALGQLGLTEAQGEKAGQQSAAQLYLTAP
jgi:hypothetical protein